MKIKKYKKKPVVIKALEFDGWHEGVMAVKKFVGDRFGKEIEVLAGRMNDPHKGKGNRYRVTIKTLEGDHKASPGDFIIQGIKGEFYPCKPDIFKETYEELPRLTNTPVNKLYHD